VWRRENMKGSAREGRGVLEIELQCCEEIVRKKGEKERKEKITHLSRRPIVSEPSTSSPSTHPSRVAGSAFRVIPIPHPLDLNPPRLRRRLHSLPACCSNGLVRDRKLDRLQLRELARRQQRLLEQRHRAFDRRRPFVVDPGGREGAGQLVTRDESEMFESWNGVEGVRVEVGEGDGENLDRGEEDALEEGRLGRGAEEEVGWWLRIVESFEGWVDTVKEGGELGGEG
jgi:hypothetical protein